MAPIPELPFDVIEIIVNQVAANQGYPNNYETFTKKHYRDLKALSLTSRLFLPLTRARIFANADFLVGSPGTDRERARLTTQFNALLNERPEIVKYVRFITYRIWETDFPNTELHHLLGRFTNVKSLNLTIYPLDASWETISKPLLDVILGLLRLPSLTLLGIWYMTNIPAYIFENTLHLKHLDLTGVDFEASETETDVTKSSSQVLNHDNPMESRPRLKSLEITSTNIDPALFTRMFLGSSKIAPLFDTTNLESFEIDLQTMATVKNANAIFQMAGGTIQELELYVTNLELDTLDLASLTTLQTFNVHSVLLVQEELEDSLHGITTALLNASRSSALSLKAIFLQIDLQTEGPFEHCWRSWPGILDAFLSDPKCVPVLREVNINVNSAGNRLGDAMELKARFARLSESQTVSFDFKVDRDWNQ